MIVPCGRKDTIGKPILYATTDVFLKRFGLNSIDELPDYNDLMSQIAELNNTILLDDNDGNYLYSREEYNPDEDPDNIPEENEQPKKEEEPPKEPVYEDGYEVPDFLDEDDVIIKIK